MSGPGQLPPNNSYQTIAAATWDLNRHRWQFTAQVQADYGKWLVATITAVHLAGLYLVSQEGVPAEVRLNPDAYWPFIYGICLILASGLATWANWTLVSNLFSTWLDANMLTNQAYWPKDGTKLHRAAIHITFWLPLLLGLASAICIPYGACTILDRLPAKTEVEVATPIAPPPRVIGPQFTPLSNTPEKATKPVAGPVVSK